MLYITNRRTIINIFFKTPTQISKKKISTQQKNGQNSWTSTSQKRISKWALKNEKALNLINNQSNANKSQEDVIMHPPHQHNLKWLTYQGLARMRSNKDFQALWSGVWIGTTTWGNSLPLSTQVDNMFTLGVSSFTSW